MTVECQLDTSKQKTVTFKFDRDDMVPIDIANNLVSIYRVSFFFFSTVTICFGTRFGLQLPPILCKYEDIPIPDCRESVATVSMRNFCRIDRRYSDAAAFGS